jgi:hypothetical protein
MDLADQGWRAQQQAERQYAHCRRRQMVGDCQDRCHDDDGHTGNHPVRERLGQKHPAQRIGHGEKLLEGSIFQVGPEQKV